jgi:hypothetical protein
VSNTIVLLTTLICLNVVDWQQTLDISNHEDLVESNCIMGKHPTDSEINTYFALALAAQIGTGFLLGELFDEKYRDYFWMGCIGLEVGMVANNYSLGLKVRF